VTTSRTTSVWTEFDESSQLSKKALGYFRGRLSNKLYQLVINEFKKRESAGFSRAKLARRIRKKPEQITRLLSGPGNWTIETVSDLMLGMGFEPELTAITISSLMVSSNPESTSQLAGAPAELAGMSATNEKAHKDNFQPLGPISGPAKSAQTVWS